MKRRDLIKWTAPTIYAVTLPAHAQTSFGPVDDDCPEPEEHQACVPEDLWPVDPYPGG